MRRALLLLTLLLPACVKYPEPYRPPIQRKPMDAGGDHSLGHFFFMNQPEADQHFISGVLPELHDGAWRWTLQKAVLQYELVSTQALHLRCDLALPEVIFQQTGPVKIAITVNGHPLGIAAFDKSGQQMFDQPVPPEWLYTGRPLLVTLESDKLWTSPADGQKRGFIVTSAGFVQ